MGSGVTIEAQDDEIQDALEAIVDGEIGLAELALKLAEGVTLTVTFGDGGTYTYENVPVEIAVQCLTDGGSAYNSLLRGKY